MKHRLLAVLVAGVTLFPAVMSAQDVAPANPETEPKRLFGIIPNYRTSPPLTNYTPLTPREKFKIALDDALDPGTFALAAVFAAEAQWTDAEPSFGHGAPAYARYFAAATTDFVVGDFMTEAIYPTLLRQDPRYFRKGSGGKWSRFGYALQQIAWTHTDARGMQVNYSEIAGNATAVAISNVYYPDSRTLSANAAKLGIQIGVDAVSNILKEFSPDLEHLFSHSSTP